MSSGIADTPASGNGSIETAAAAFLAMEDRGNATTSREKAPREHEDDDDRDEADEADAHEAEDEGDETPAEDDADDADDTDAEDADTDEEPEDDADAQDEGEDEAPVDLDRAVTVKIDGKETQVKLSEALAGYQRQADYSRKTAELSTERNAFHVERQAVQAERAQYAQLLPALAARLEAQTEQVDWARLKEEDPVEFAVKRFEHQEAQEQLAAVRAEQARLQSVADEEAQAEFNKRVEAEGVKLLEALPAWKDPAIRERDKAAIRAYGLKIGFSEADLNGASDSRAIVALYKAMKFDRLMAKSAKGKAPGAGAPAPKPLKVGSSNRPPARVTAKTDAMKRLSRSGSVEDAAAVFMHL
jgi:hypothetical protein